MPAIRPHSQSMQIHPKVRILCGNEPRRWPMPSQGWRRAQLLPELQWGPPSVGRVMQEPAEGQRACNPRIQQPAYMLRRKHRTQRKGRFQLKLDYCPCHWQKKDCFNRHHRRKLRRVTEERPWPTSRKQEHPDQTQRESRQPKHSRDVSPSAGD